mgnify:CR=1 FL=1
MAPLALIDSDRSGMETSALPDVLRATLEGLPIGAILVSPDRAILHANREVERLFGCAPSEYLGNPDFWREHVHPDDLAAGAQCPVDLVLVVRLAQHTERELVRETRDLLPRDPLPPLELLASDGHRSDE